MTKSKKDDKPDHVASLIAKAENTHDSHDAMRFSQAAVNCANAMSVMLTVKAHS